MRDAISGHVHFVKIKDSRKHHIQMFDNLLTQIEQLYITHAFLTARLQSSNAGY